MLLKIIVSVTSSLGIGKMKDLLVKIPDDLKRFQELTQDNIVIMGRKTWDSLPERPLKNRINIVVTNNKAYRKTKLESVFFANMNELEKLLKNLSKTDPSKIGYIIGGSEIISLMMCHQNPEMRPSELLLTEIMNYSEKRFGVPTVYLKELNEEYILTRVSENRMYKQDEYRYLCYYREAFLRTSENVYLNGIRKILSRGVERMDRTQTGVLSTFGEQFRFNLVFGFPLLTTKSVPFKSVVEELLWFCRGDTDANILKQKGVNIWNANTSREFLDNCGLKNYPEGVLGPGYGWSFRHYNANYSTTFSDTSKIDRKLVGGFDQLEYVVNLLKCDPMSRRIYMNYWNPNELSNIALPPCHLSIQFYVEFVDGIKYLSGHVYQRSMDMFLGAPWNIASYSLLIMILSKKTGMIAKELIISTGDTHIYKNHIKQVNEQLTRNPRPLPKVLLSEEIVNKDWHEISVDDFSLVGYFPYKSIQADMAI